MTAMAVSHRFARINDMPLAKAFGDAGSADGFIYTTKQERLLSLSF
jgi:hypothetical protein